MRIKIEQFEDEGQINLMPLIDMVFLLLIFFLVATTIAQEERDLSVQLPGTSTVEPLSAVPKQLIINILADGTTRVAGQTYGLEELAGLIRRVAAEQPNRQVLIRADLNSKHLYFAEVAQLCLQAGIDKAKIGYIVEKTAVSPAR